ncbi:MAG TPA: gliding motility-associated ABC transporter ATP-binding subunit GldA [Bacteroidia bacterium]|nr:gliding motility-associated ABC transporter ATP-binding subunit GldA [Bacteroidia bacterium]
MSVLVSNISKNYGSQKALDDVSFNVQGGQVVGFLGPNGAGKSTMMKIITCFIPQTSGTATVCGYDVSENSLEVRKVVGYLPEHNPLYLEMYVKEYLEFIAGLHHLAGTKKARISEMIEITGLKAEQNKKIGALSKGYRQRVGLAQALIHDPKVLILDEPTSGLDPNQLSEIRSLIQSIGKEKTVILSTHIMQEVEAICDRVIIINKGKIVADENTEILRKTTSPADSILIEFDAACSKNQLMKIEGVVFAEPVTGNIWRLGSDGKTDIRPHVFQFAVQHQLAVLSMQKQEQKLEDIFHQLTKNNNA